MGDFNKTLNSIEGFSYSQTFDVADISGWYDDDHVAAFHAFLKSAQLMAEKPPKTRELGLRGEALTFISKIALENVEANDPAQCRTFFEDHFMAVGLDPEKSETSGFVTGYYEPEVPGSLVETNEYTAPLLRRPDDLVSITDANRPKGWPEDLRFGMKTKTGIIPYFDRRQIDQGAVDPDDHALVYLKNKVEAFFIHIQGSAKIRLPDGDVMRVTYAAKSGHDYTPIGRILREWGELERSEITMTSIRQWLHNHPDRVDELLWHNRSFIFFEEVLGLKPEDGPIAAAKVPLSPGRSLAVDRLIHTFGTPIWVSTDPQVLSSRLMIAQDTGSAIVGAARGDIYIGSGDDAGVQAGEIKHRASFTLLVPKT